MAILYEHYNTGDQGSVYIYDDMWQAQTFTPSVAHKITSVKLKLFRVGSPGTVTVSIQGTDGSGHPDGVDLCSGTTNGNTLPTGPPHEWREITLGDGCDLSASTKYAIVIRIDSEVFGNRIQWRIDSSGAYTGGCTETSIDGGSSWSSATSQDGMFEEYGIAGGFPPGLSLGSVAEILGIV